MHRANKFYTTSHELAFISGLGHHRKQPHSQQKLLEKYLQAAKNRYDWKGIDRVEIINYAKKLLTSY